MEERPAEVSANFASTNFLVTVCGQIETAIFPEIDNIYCKYCFVYGTDWSLVCGTEEGVSQVAKKSRDGRQVTAWNLPVDITFKSSNPFGWPQIVVTVYGYDFFGRDVIRGYGQTYIPPMPGTHTIQIPMFVPESSSLINSFVGWLSGKRPEFVNPKAIAQGDGRGVIRVTSQGFVNVAFNVLLKDFKKHGFISYSQMKQQKTLYDPI